MSHVAGRFTGIIRDALGAALAQDSPGLEVASGSTYRSNMRRLQAASNLSALTTQVMLSTALYLEEGDTVTSLTFVSGATAAGTPTNYWAALYSPLGELLEQSADQLSAAWAANTAKTMALADPVEITESGVYYAAVMVKATTPPTLVGATVQVGVSGAVTSGESVLARTSGSALEGTAPATIASPTTVGTVPYVLAK